MLRDATVERLHQYAEFLESHAPSVESCAGAAALRLIAEGRESGTFKRVQPVHVWGLSSEDDTAQMEADAALLRTLAGSDD